MVEMPKTHCKLNNLEFGGRLKTLIGVVIQKEKPNCLDLFHVNFDFYSDLKKSVCLRLILKVNLSLI